MKKKNVNGQRYKKAVRDLEANKRSHHLEKLEELFKEEHGGCDQNTCCMTKAFESGYSLLALEIFFSSGASSDEFNKLFNELPKKALRIATNHESNCFTADPECHAVECECSAYVYNTDGEKIHCDSCGKWFAQNEIKFNEQEIQFGDLRVTASLAYGSTPVLDLENRSIFFTDNTETLSDKLKKQITKITKKGLKKLPKTKTIKLSTGNAIVNYIMDDEVENDDFYIQASLSFDKKSNSLRLTDQDIKIASRAIDIMDIDILCTLKSICFDLNELLSKAGINNSCFAVTE